MIRAISARLVTNGSAEELKGLDVTLAGEQHARAAVVPDRARGSFAVAGLDLSQVVVTEQELDALAWTAGGVAGEARDPSEVGRFIERQEQTWHQDSALGARLRGRAPQEGEEEGGEKGSAALGFFGWGDQVERASLAEEAIKVECIRARPSGGGHTLVRPERKRRPRGGGDRARLLVGGEREGEQ